MGNYARQIPSFPETAMDKILIASIYKHIKDKKLNGNSRQCTQGKVTFIQVDSLYSKVTSLVDKAGAVNIVYLDFSEIFDTVSHNVIPDKLVKYALGMQSEVD